MLPPTSAMSALRAATKTAHDSLEQGLRIASPHASQTDYLDYLQDLRGWLAPFEAALWQAHWPAGMQPDRRAGKLAWIDEDLEVLGLRPGEIAHLPSCPGRLPVASLAERFGVAYVVEGAQLGTKVLAKRLAPHFASWQPRWLIGYGAENGHYWRQFMQAAEQHLDTPLARTQAAQAAIAAFTQLDAWFASRLQARHACKLSPDAQQLATLRSPAGVSAA